MNLRFTVIGFGREIVQERCLQFYWKGGELMQMKRNNFCIGMKVRNSLFQ